MSYSIDDHYVHCTLSCANRDPNGIKFLCELKPCGQIPNSYDCPSFKEVEKFLPPEDDSTVYCPTCGSCGESGCCPPTMCNTVANEIVLNDVLELLGTYVYDHQIEEIERRLRQKFDANGHYCWDNVQSWKEMSTELDSFYLALSDIASGKEKNPRTRAIDTIEAFYPPYEGN